MKPPSSDEQTGEPIKDLLKHIAQGLHARHIPPWLVLGVPALAVAILVGYVPMRDGFLALRQDAQSLLPIQQSGGPVPDPTSTNPDNQANPDNQNNQTEVASDEPSQSEKPQPSPSPVSSPAPGVLVSFHAPQNGAIVQEYETVRGQITNLSGDMQAFLVVRAVPQTQADQGLWYPQAQLEPDLFMGNWEAEAVYRSPGWQYENYVVVTSNPASIQVLSDPRSRRNGLNRLPEAIEITPAPIVVQRSMDATF